MSNVEIWLKEFLAEFRNQCKQLSQEEKAKVSNLDNFSPPCQMLFLHLKDVNFQYLIVTHDEAKSDGEIIVYGPIPTYEAVDRLDSILKDPRWNRELSEEEKKFVWEKTIKFRDVLERVFLGIINELRNLPFVKPESTIIGEKSWLTANSFIWKIRGNIANLSHIEVVNKIVEDAKKQLEVAKTEPKPPGTPLKPVIKGSGTYFYPPIWIGKLPGKTFREQALGSFIFPKKAFDMKYKGKVVVVNDDGFIAIGEQDISKATRMLNEIMATGLLLGLPFFAARELEVSDSEIDSSTLDITSHGIRTLSLRTQLFFEFPFARKVTIIERTEVDKEKLVGLIQQAERITRDPDIADFLVFLLEAHTCLHSSEYMQSFVMSWVIIERQMFWLWQRFLKEEQVPRARREKIMNPVYWTVDFVLETLNLLGQVSQEDYDVLMKLKNKRNDIMHEGESVSQSEAEKCFEIAKMIVKQRVG